jgi:hypothetical protein
MGVLVGGFHNSINPRNTVLGRPMSSAVHISRSDVSRLVTFNQFE